MPPHNKSEMVQVQISIIHQ